MAQSIKRAVAKSTLPVLITRMISMRLRARSLRFMGTREPRDAGKAAGAGHVVETGAGVEMMAAAGASADCGTVTVVAVGKGVATETDDEARVHGDLRGVIGSG